MGPTTFIYLGVLSVIHISECGPPKITKPDIQERLDIVDDAEHTLQCIAEGTDVSYQWKFNDSPVDTNNFVVNTTTGTLTIESFGNGYEGTYQCFASGRVSEDSEAVAMSPIITMRKVQLGADWPDGDNINVNGTEGNYLNLTCDNPPVSVPAAQYDWYLTLGTDSDGQITTDNRIYVTEDGTLHFMYLTRDDQSELLYKCGVYNNRLNLIKLGSPKKLTVTNIDGGIPQRPPENMFKTKKAKFLYTKEAVLECVYSGFPIPTTTWKNNRKAQISPGDKYQLTNNNRKLIILDLEEEDEGLYWCEGSNSVSVENSIFLDVTSGPMWLSSLSSQTAVQGRDAVFFCKARAAIGDDELAPPQWFKNGQPLETTNTAKLQFSDQDRKLIVKNLNKTTDIMCFQCKVSNDIGYELADGCLTVILPIEVTTQPSLEQEITQGDYVNLTVIGITDPAYTLQYKWYFRNVSYSSPKTPPFVILNETSRHAYINTSDLTEEEYDSINGTYIVELFHDDDRLNVSIEVILTEPPVTGTVAAAAVDLWWVALIVALVILLIVIVIIIVICHRKRQEGIYPLDKSEKKHDMDPEKELADSAFQDVSRVPQDDDYPYVKTPDLGLSIDDDDTSSLIPSRKGSLDETQFNEDGSFIGQYGTKK